ncbi:flippase [Flagellimonas lutimaris]|uniref:Flippase n=1 Tax=Flagellimonas lutimaris TaxID=475082 RepID=A0A3A1N820_9FLAO|nr:oligosaccharide flippase family protein [Allomuricauda lutimaris]RIV34994.1 flippase [Allomuricauda lutimaris]
MIKKILQKNENKVIAKNYFFLVLLQAANYVLPLLTLPYLVRVLGAERYGLVMFAQSLAIFFNVFVDFGFSLSGTREISLQRNNKSKLSKIFWGIILIKLVLIVISFFIIITIVYNFDRFSNDVELYLLSFGMVVGQALFPVWFFQGIEKMKFITYINIFSKVVFTLLVFLLIKQTEDYKLVPLFNSLGYILGGLFGLFFSLKYINFRKPGFSLIKSLLRDSFKLFVSNFAISLYTASNVFILGLFAGNTIVGVYSSFEKLIIAIKNGFIPIYQAIFPWLSKQPNKAKIIAKITPFIVFIGMVISTVIFIFGTQIIEIIYSDSLISSYSGVFKILGLIALFSGWNMLYNTLYFPSTKEYGTRMKILITGGILNILFGVVVAKLYGIFGMAYVVVSTELLLLILGRYYYKKKKKKEFESQIT